MHTHYKTSLVKLLLIVVVIVVGSHAISNIISIIHKGVSVLQSLLVRARQSLLQLHVPLMMLLRTAYLHESLLFTTLTTHN